jgi:predicted acyl esterase
MQPLLTGPRFHPQSFSELNPQQKSEHSAWETPDPAYWTGQGYAVVRADERGTGEQVFDDPPHPYSGTRF